MIKKILSLLLIAVFAIPSYAQGVSVKGKVTDLNNEALVGVNIYVNSTASGTSTNQKGEYILENVMIGETQIRFSSTGYTTQYINYIVSEDVNQLDVKLEEASYELPTVMVTAQKREQEMLDVPMSISAISQAQMDELSINTMDQFSTLIPGLNVRIQSNQRPNFVIRGLSSDEVSPNAQARVSLFMNNAPISRASGGVLELYDMERIEVLKGPQGTLFGRGAQIGAIHFVTKKPTNEFEGYIEAGLGSFNEQQINFAINTPIIKNVFNTRIAAFYHKQDGYVENIDGTDLNGKDSKGVRFSARLFPCSKGRVDFTFNYQKDEAPGIAFINGVIPHPDQMNDFFNGKAYLNDADNLAAEKDLLNLNLNIRRQLSPNVYISSITSYQTNKSYESFDGDGSLLDAMNMIEDVDAKMWNQELRVNYNVGKKFTGFTGVNYLFEKVDQDYTFSTNEQHLAYLILQMPAYIQYDATGNPYPMTNLPADPMLGPLAGAPLGTYHAENTLTSATNQAFEIFTDATYAINDKLSVSAGLRLVFDKSEVNNQAGMSDGTPSILGNLTGRAPNVLFASADYAETDDNFSGFTGRLVADYKLKDNVSLFASYTKGRRPNVIQFDQSGNAQVLDDETLNSFDLGMKAQFDNVFKFDITAFLYKYKNFQTTAWDADAIQYLVKDAGKATSYGFETSFHLNIMKGLSLFGNYTFIKATYDDKDEDGSEQEYADNQFRLTPEHSLNLNAKYVIPTTSNLQLFVIPSLIYKSKYYFEDANSDALSQDGHALVNVSLGVKSLNQRMSLTFYAQNLFDKEYLLSAGNMGNFFGVPTFIPAVGRTFGFKLRWDF